MGRRSYGIHRGDQKTDQRDYSDGRFLQDCLMVLPIMGNLLGSVTTQEPIQQIIPLIRGEAHHILPTDKAPDESRLERRS